MRLQAQLDSQIKDNKKLHKIIQESGRDESGALDPDITQQFTELYNRILQLVKGHFSFQGSRTSIGKRYDRLSNDDRDLWLRARITDTVYEHFFAPSAQLFGMKKEREEALMELEQKFIERQGVYISLTALNTLEVLIICSLTVSNSDIIDWRVQTVKMATKAFKDRRARYRVDDLFHSLCEEFKPLSSPGVQAWKRAQDAVDDLANMAFDLAITLRASKSTYEWTQKWRPSAVPGAEFERISGFNLRNKTTPVKPVLILFGSLVKIDNGERNVLRMGDLLEGGLLED